VITLVHQEDWPSSESQTKSPLLQSRLFKFNPRGGSSRYGVRTRTDCHPVAPAAVVVNDDGLPLHSGESIWFRVEEALVLCYKAGVCQFSQV